MSIGKRLAAKRKEKGYTQKDMPDLLGISDRTYWTYENGSPIPSDIILKLMELFDISSDWLLTGKEPECKTITDSKQISPVLVKELQKLAQEAAKEEFNGLLSQYGLKGVLE